MRAASCASCGSDGVATSVDLLGEATVTAAEADRYAARCARRARRRSPASTHALAPRPLLERDAAGPMPRVNLSVKVSALTPLLRPDAPELGTRRRRRAAAPAAAPRARPRRAPAHRHGVASTRARPSTDLVLELLAEDEFARRARPPGSCCRPTCATRPSSSQRLLDVGRRARRARRPLIVRLVKGAYWDHEVVEAAPARLEPAGLRGQGRERPQLRGAHPALLEARAAGAGARRDRLAQPALGRARDRRQPRCSAAATADLELQVLRGLGDDLAGRRSPRPAGGCAPTARSATSSPGMAYLVRRLLENTSNESFLHEQVARRPARGAAGGAMTTLAPVRQRAARSSCAARRSATGCSARCAALDAEPAAARAGLDRRRARATATRLVSTDPGAPDRGRRDRRAARRDADVAAAVEAARAAFRALVRRRPATERAAVLVRAAALLRERRAELAALAVRECAKPWDRGRRRRLRGDRLPRVLRARRGRARARRRRCCQVARRAQRDALRARAASRR